MTDRPSHDRGGKGTPAAWPGLIVALNHIVDSGLWAKLKPAGKAVWLPLARHANSEGMAWPSKGTLTAEANVTRTSVYRGIEELAAVGLIRAAKQNKGGARQSTTVYQLLMPATGTTGGTGATRTAGDTGTTDGTGTRTAGGTVPVPLVQQRGTTSGTQSPKETLRETLLADAGAPAGGNGTKAGRGGRKRDELFEAIAEVCGLRIDELTKSARGGLNRAAAELRQLGAGPLDVRHRAAVWAERYKNASLTPAALAKHWPSLSANGTTPGGLTLEHVEPSDEEFAAIMAGGDR